MPLVSCSELTISGGLNLKIDDRARINIPVGLTGFFAWLNNSDNPLYGFHRSTKIIDCVMTFFYPIYLREKGASKTEIEEALLICIDKLKTGLKLLEQIKKAIDVDEDQSHTRSKTRPKSTSSIDLDGV
jgi:hypothetical protein